MSQAVVDKLLATMQGAKGVPALEDTVTGILTSLRDVQKGNGDLATQISGDFAMTQKVLKLANSAMYAPFANGISTVSAGLNVLGNDALLHLVLGAPMVSAAELKQDDSLSRTLLASELARTISTQRTENASIAALMFDLGTLMATRFLPDETAAISRKVGTGATTDAAAAEILGMSYQELGTHVARRWRLPTEIVSIIDGTGDETLIGIARFSAQASAMIHAGEAEAVHELVATLDIPGIDKTGLGNLVCRKLDEIVPAVQAIRPDSPDDILNQLHTLLSQEKKHDVDELARALFPQLAEALKTSRCLLFMAIKAGDYCIRCGHGKGIDELKSKLRLSAEFKPTAFHAAIKNNTDVVIPEVAKLKPAALPDSYKTLLPSVASFVILPIANTHVSGLLYLDWESPHELPHSTLIAIRQLRDLFLPFFPH